MKVFITLCMVALAFGHPVKENDSGSFPISKDQKPIANERVLHKRSIQADGKLIEREDHNNANEHIIQKGDVQDFEAHSVEKRDAPVAHDIQKRHVDDQEADDGHVRQARDVQEADDGKIRQERDVQEADDGKIRQERDVQEADDGKIRQERDVQEADDGKIRQERDVQNVEGVANQDGEYQEAFSNEGAHAKQGADGQIIYASDYGGPIVQILQHVYKSGCCECGCDCGCPQEHEDGDL